MNTNRIQSFTATAVAIPQGTRVSLDSDGKISAAGATQAAIGTARYDIAASAVGDVVMFGETHFVIAAGAIAVGAVIYPAASGKVNDVLVNLSITDSGPDTVLIPQPIGVAIEAASADGDVIRAIIGTLF
jgi:hypothetical protein